MRHLFGCRYVLITDVRTVRASLVTHALSAWMLARWYSYWLGEMQMQLNFWYSYTLLIDSLA
jgi:hypothetical protein